MALVTCPDCRKEVSDAAPACPGCGRPMAAAPLTPAQVYPPSTRVEATSRVVLLRVVGILGCLGGTVTACGSMAASSDGGVALGGVLFVVGFVSFIASRVIQA